MKRKELVGMYVFENIHSKREQEYGLLASAAYTRIPSIDQASVGVLENACGLPKHSDAPRNNGI